MRHAPPVGRSLRRLQRLRDHLPAEHAAHPAGLSGPAIQVGIQLLDVEQRGKLVDQRLGAPRRHQ